MSDTSQDDLFVLPAGTRLREYEIRRVLGRGGFGITYLARDLGLDQLVAIKEFLPQGLAVRTRGITITASSRANGDILDKYRKYFLREAQALARFDHPNIVRVLTSFEANGTAYTVMRFEDGVAFEDYLRDLGRVPTERELRKLLATALDGVAAVHRAGLLHRDISARNILVRPVGDTVLIDFGSVRDAVTEGADHGHKSSSAQTCTDGYSPPEVYSSGGTRGAATDIYGLGAVLYRAVSGRTPVSAPDRQHGILEHDTDPLIPATQIATKDFRREFLEAIDWALMLRAKDRPQSIEQWQSESLGKTAAEEPVAVAPPPSLPVASPAFVRRHWVAVGTALLVGAGSGALVTYRGADHGADTAATDERIRAATAAMLEKVEEVRRSEEARKATAKRAETAEARVVELLESARKSDEARKIAEDAKNKAEREARAQENAARDAEKALKAAEVRIGTLVGAARKVEEERQSKGNQRPGQVFRDCADCPEMVVVPAGSFTMGSPESEPGRSSDEGPQHRVTIPRDFAVGRYEVTQAEWRSVMGTDPSRFKGDRLPVETVSWNDAQDFVRKLGAKTGQTYRLLTEAEWEYAARAGTTTAYWWGMTASHEYANYGTDQCCGGLASGRDRWEYTSPVGSFSANGFGLYDMHGNVWEWGEDCYVVNFRNAPVDGSAVSGTNSCLPVSRGGSWDDAPRLLRSAFRFRKDPDGQNFNLGLRIARTLP